jgi:hypothetical protein
MNLLPSPKFLTHSRYLDANSAPEGTSLVKMTSVRFTALIAFQGIESDLTAEVPNSTSLRLQVFSTS